MTKVTDQQLANALANAAQARGTRERLLAWNTVAITAAGLLDQTIEEGFDSDPRGGKWAETAEHYGAKLSLAEAQVRDCLQCLNHR